MSLISHRLLPQFTTIRRLTRLGKPVIRVNFFWTRSKFCQSPRQHINVVLGSPEMFEIRKYESCPSHVVQISFGQSHIRNVNSNLKKRASTQLPLADLTVDKHFAATPRITLQFAYIVLIRR
jgi:hypothetical protein